MTKITRLIPASNTPQAMEEMKLARRLRLAERARADGARNFPAPDSTELTPDELTVITLAQQRIDDVSQWLVRRLKDVAHGVAALEPTETERDHLAVIETARFDLEKLSDERREEITARVVDMRSRARELAVFQRTHGLTARPARYVHWMWTAGVFASVLAAETIFNASSFAQAVDGGLSEGATMAAAFAFVNAMLAYGLVGAFGLRHTGHIQPALRVAGWAAVLLGVVLLAVWNAFVAHYRVLLSENPDRSVVGAWSALWQDPMGFMNQDGGPVLFSVGLVCAAAFAAKGFLMHADRYPDYKPVDQAHKKAEAAFEATKLAFRDDAVAMVEARISQIDGHLASAEDKTRRAIDLINSGDIDRQTARHAACESCAVAQRLIALIRRENVAVRDLAPPRHFGALPDFDAGLRDVPDIDFAALREARRADVAALRNEVRETKQQLRALAMEALARVTADISQAEVRGDRQSRDRHSPAPAALAYSVEAAE